jgi:hypothetical protein
MRYFLQRRRSDRQVPSRVAVLHNASAGATGGLVLAALIRRLKNGGTGFRAGAENLINRRHSRRTLLPIIIANLSALPT